MAVYRVEKTRNYTVMSNQHLRDKRLSLKAKGLLSLMLSLPEDWDYTTKGLARICKDGVDSICTTVRELEGTGYIVRKRERRADGTLGSIEYTILEQSRQADAPKRENPVQAEKSADAPKRAFPEQVKPEQEKPAQLNIQEQSKEKQNTDVLTSFHSFWREDRSTQKDRMERRKIYSEQIRENISYDYLSNYTNADRERLDELVSLMLDTVCSTKSRIIICVPSFITDVEKRAVVEAAMSAGSRKAYLIDEPIAALIGAGVNIGKARGNMVVDIGGGTTDVAIVSMNGIVTSHSVRAAGNTLDQAIIRYMQTKYKLLIGERTAERLKIEMTNLYDPRADVTAWVKGRNLVSGLPEMQEVSELEIFEAVEDVVADIIEAIKTVLEETPPELVGDIYENGVLMAGGGAMLGGLRKLVERTLQVKCVVAKDAIHCVAKGTAIAFRKMDTLLDGFENIAVYQFK